MRRLGIALLAAGLIVGCGDDEASTVTSGGSGTQTAAPTTAPTTTTAAAAPAAKPKPKPKGTAITVRDSEFGSMLFGPNRQAIYIFERDGKGPSRCYDECAELWPPVYTDGRPAADTGIDADLLGTTRRSDGRVQVTYADQPLYYYAHEGPGEVRCHNVFLNGGLWWVLGPNGKRRP